MLEGAPEGVTFRGFHIRVARVAYDYEEAIGFFTHYDIRTTQAQSWFPQIAGTQVSQLSWVLGTSM